MNPLLAHLQSLMTLAKIIEAGHRDDPMADELRERMAHERCKLTDGELVCVGWLGEPLGRYEP